MIHHHYHHRSSGGCLAAILAMLVAGGVVWVFEHGWPYMLGALAVFVLVAMVRGARAGAAKDKPASQSLMAPIDEHRRPVRMTDAEREQVAQALRAAGADGRLSISELDERLSAAYAARKWADAAPLLEDLGVAH